MLTGQRNAPDEKLQPLTIFAFVWASQQTFQLTYFDEWFENGNLLGYVFMGLTLSVMLFPGNTWLFVAMLVGSIVYFVNEWPFVVNHIFIDTFLRHISERDHRDRGGSGSRRCAIYFQGQRG